MNQWLILKFTIYLQIGIASTALFPHLVCPSFKYFVQAGAEMSLHFLVPINATEKWPGECCVARGTAFEMSLCIALAVRSRGVEDDSNLDLGYDRGAVLGVVSFKTSLRSRANMPYG